MSKILCLGFFIVFCFEVNGQLTEKKVCFDLPVEYNYDFRTDDYFLIDGGFGKKVETGDSILLGCSDFAKKGLPIAFIFSIQEKRKTARKRLRAIPPISKDKRIAMHLYAIKRKDNQRDEKVINALDYYCFYGQSNYYFLTKDYILFTYAIAGDALTRADVDGRTKIENQLVKNLNQLNH